MPGTGISLGKLAGASAIGSVGNGIFGFFSNLINNNAQKKLYQQQYQDSIDFYDMQMNDQWSMWNANNAYNSPAAQAQRLREAGINPDLQGVENVASDMPTAPTPNVPQQGYIPFSEQVFAVLPNILEVAERLQQLDANNIAIDKSLNGLVDDYLMNLPMTIDFNSVLNGDEDAIKQIGGRLWDTLPPMSKSRKKLFGNKLYSRIRNPEFLKRYYSALVDTGNSVFDLENLTGNPLFSGTGSTSRDLSDFLRLVNQVDKYTMEFNRDYYSAADGTTAGEASNVGNESIIQSKGNVNELIDKFLGANPSAFKQFLAVLARLFLQGQMPMPNVKIGPTNNTFMK